MDVAKGTAPQTADSTKARSEPRSKSAAFFDVDGTLIKTTIVHYYAYFRRRRMSPVVGKLWQAGFAMKCLYFLALDVIDRERLNIVFYRSYAGLPVDEIHALLADCHRDVIDPRRFEQAPMCIGAHRSAGRRTVLVTGSIDFIMAPLAKSLGVDDVIAPGLLVENGRFTGALDGPPVGMEEKARRVRAFALQHDIDLDASYAYGDSKADLPMLEAVGHPQVVNPDKVLRLIAMRRGWPVHRWTLSQANRNHQ